ncbi:pyruvate phosphate dikinase [bacterium SM23_31]|nr:MAG: pyruvate phosphate dikinase [bacterium SM23_31]
MSMKKMVYYFGKNNSEGGADMKALLGGKGANLAEMARIGLPVPPGFTITTEVCTAFYANNKNYPEGLRDEVNANLRKIEQDMGAEFGNQDNPLLVSCRSGARISMPGMMDTVLNIGLNDRTVEGLIRRTDNPRFGYDSYRRFIGMYGDVVMGVKFRLFENILNEIKKRRGLRHESELTTDELKEVCRRFKDVIARATDAEFPENPEDQIWGAIGAVFNSWNIPRAVTYRRLNHIPEDWGTAVNVQTMVFGNMGPTSATGVAFTRNPAAGEKVFFGEYLANAQGEDVVAGIRTPQPINKAQKSDPEQVSLEELMPEIYQELSKYYQKLENHYKDMQDLEFTIQEGKLYMLQTRVGKRTGFAALRIAVDMVDEGLIDKRTAVTRVEPEQLTHLLSPIFDPEDKKAVLKKGRFLAKGINAGPGAASGKIAFSADRAFQMANEDDSVILVRIETSPEDIHGMAASQGILTAQGGSTSHAALVARGMGKCCVVGCNALNIDYDEKKMTVNNVVLSEGDYISLDGSAGEVINGRMDTYPSEIAQVLIEKTLKQEDSLLFRRYEKFMTWVDEIRDIGVRTNADTPKDSSVAVSLGAEGIGLCRTEHMFFEGNRIDSMREMILAENKTGRIKALNKLLPMQREDFIGIFKAMNGRPVTIRTLDPPLHEFLPHTDEELEELGEKIQVDAEVLKRKARSLREANPMLGHRGCRLGNVYPEITRMQARAIIEAAVAVKKEGIDVKPEIMIPLVAELREFENQRKVVNEVAEEVFKEENESVDYLVGTMIELPRACLTADRIAEQAEFFSFGTNDLTQTTFGISRDDAGSFLPFYVAQGILPWDPFQTLDFIGVGGLMKIGIEKGRKTRPDLKIGICGEHGGDPETVKFCRRVGLNYVSCSPYRIPVAKLAAAQEVLEKE